ncbi:MAG: efflux RND transporter permease subunit [Breznakibacter sp.]
MKIAEISIKRTTIPVVIFVLLGLAGVFCYTLLNKELTPSMAIPVNAIITVYPGAAPSEVESSVTKKIEDAVSALEGIDKISSNSYESLSMITIQYKDGTNADLSLQECERRVNAIKADLPAVIKDIQFKKFDLNQLPIINLALNSSIPDKEFFDIVDKEIKPRLAQIKGVAQIDVVGGNQREIEIKADVQKLEQYGVTLPQIQQVVAASNIDFPTGKVKDDQSKFIVRLSGKIKNLEEIRNLTIGTTREGTAIKIGDVATVNDGVRESSKLARINGQPAIGLTIQKQADGNAVEISDAVKAMIADFEAQYAGENLQFIIASDTSDFTREAVNSVMVDLLIAIILVSVAMLLFLHTFRNLIFIVVSIPTSVISTFAFFYLFGFSLNLLTLLALSIVIGAIVDDAIVVLENIYRHMEMGKGRVQASLDACKELGLTVTSITVVLIAVFLPIGLTGGVTGQLLKSFSLTIVVSILLSLLVSFTLVPLLTSRYGQLKLYNRQKWLDRFLLAFEHSISKIRIGVLRMLKWCLAHKKLTLGAATVLLVLSMSLVSGGFIQTEFMDAGDNGEFIVMMELEKTATLTQNNNLCIEIEKMMLRYPEIKNIYTKVGSQSGGMSVIEAPYATEFVVKLVPKKKRRLSSKLFSSQLHYDLSKTFAGASFKVKEVSIVGMSSSPIEFYVRGNDFEETERYSEIVADQLRQISGTKYIETSVQNGAKEIVVQFDREKLAKLGLSIGEIGSQMYMAYEGNRDLKYSEGNYEYDIFISLDEFDRENKSDIENISFHNHSGQLIKLSQVATINESESPSTLLRYNKMPAIQITGNLVGKTIGTVGEEIKQRLAGIEKPAGVDVVYAGDMEQQGDSFSNLLIALMASVIFMYLIMVALYNSYIYPLVVMLSVPLAIIGALLALALAGKSLSLFSIMGIIMLMGLVAKNAILVVDFANNLQAEGKNPVIAVIHATNERFRPIVMTNLALIIGLLPIALATGAGAEWKSGLGWVLIGGLTSSMFLSFIVVPVLYVILDRLVVKKQAVL